MRMVSILSLHCIRTLIHHLLRRDVCIRLALIVYNRHITSRHEFRRDLQLFGKPKNISLLFLAEPLFNALLESTASPHMTAQALVSVAKMGQIF